MRYYFHVKDGRTALDGEGMELADIAAVKEEALLSSADLIKGGVRAQFWSGEPWTMFVTDQPDGGGNTFSRWSSRLAWAHKVVVA